MTTAAQVESVVVREIPLEQLEASRNNPRRTMNEADLAELAASIREIGITVPLLVRPIDLDCMSGEPLPGEAKVGDAYEIVCGHRRSEGATLAGLTSVPCIVRNLSDEEAADIALIDNLQRVDVPPLEEAEAFGELLDRCGSIQAVAAKVGKEQSYVAKRLKLRELTTWSCMALGVQLITIDHALLLARLADAEQNEALKWCLDKNAGSKTPVDKVIQSRIETRKKREKHYYGAWEPETVQRLKEHIEGSSGVKLDRAPWPMEEDYLLPDAGSCLDCEKNTKANAPLFGDLAIGEPTCTDGACFKDKTTAWVQIKLKEAGEDLQSKTKKRVPRLSRKFSAVKPATCFNDITAAGAMSTTADPSKVLKAGQWIEAKKNSCPNVRTGITVDWSDANDRGYMHGDNKLRKPGEALLVCIAAGCKVHKKEWEKPKQSSEREERVSPEEEKRQESSRKFREKTEGELRGKVFKAILDKLEPAQAVHMVADSCWRAPELRKSLLAMFPEISSEKLEAFVLFANQFHSLTNASFYNVSYNPTKTDDGKQAVARSREPLWKLAKSVGVDADKVVTEYFHHRHDGGDLQGHAAIAPAEDVLLPKGYKPPARPADKPAAKKPILSSKTRKEIAAAQKKRWADAKKKGAKK